MRRVIRLVMVASALAAVVTAALAIGEDWLRPRGPVEVRRETCEFPSPLEVGRGYDLTITVHNGQPIPVRLIGGAEACGAGGCAIVHGLPLTIPPGEDREIEVTFKPGAPGPIDYEGPIYTDCPSYPTIALQLVGTVL